MLNEPAELKTMVIKIIGMHCSSCAMNIDFELEDLEGVEKVSTQYASQKTKITFDPQKVNKEQILKVIESLQYKAEICDDMT